MVRTVPPEMCPLGGDSHVICIDGKEDAEWSAGYNHWPIGPLQMLKKRPSDSGLRVAGWGQNAYRRRHYDVFADAVEVVLGHRRGNGCETGRDGEEDRISHPPHRAPAPPTPGIKLSKITTVRVVARRSRARMAMGPPDARFGTFERSHRYSTVPDVLPRLAVAQSARMWPVWSCCQKGPFPISGFNRPSSI